MNWQVVAAAGLAEAAWLFDALLLGVGLAVIAFVAWYAIFARNPGAGITAVVVMVGFTLLVEPWRLLMTIDPTAYDDPDIAYAVGNYRMVGAAWVFDCLFVLTAFILSWRNRTQTETESEGVIPLDARRPDEPGMVTCPYCDVRVLLTRPHRHCPSCRRMIPEE